MPRRASVTLFTLLSAAPATAEEIPEPPPETPPPPPAEHGYLGAGVSLTGDHFFNLAFAFEGGLKLPDVPLWIRGSADVGGTGDFEGTGPFRRARLGIEARVCGVPVLCGFGSLEAGYQTQVWESSDEDTEHHRGAIVTGRFGLDAGGSNLRFRLALEVSRYRHASDLAGSSTRWIGGGGVTMSLVYRL